MTELSREEIEEQAQAVTAALAQLPGVVALLEQACPWLVEVLELSIGAHEEAVGSLIVGYSKSPAKLRDAIEEWHAFTQPQEPWRTGDA